MKEENNTWLVMFLHTYGWSILVVLLAIGGLAYFGVFSFSPITEPCDCNGRECEVTSVYTNDANFEDDYLGTKCCITGDIDNETNTCYLHYLESKVFYRGTDLEATKEVYPE